MVLDTVLVVLRFFLALIFLLSAATKLLVPAELFKSVKNYRIIPQILVKPFGWTLVIVEVAVFVSLLLGWQPVITAIVAGVLFLSFIGAGAKVMIKKQVTSCGCFGLLYKEKIGPATVVRDGILLLMAASIAVFGGGLPTLATMLTGMSPAVQVPVIVYLAALILLLVIVIRQTLAVERNKKQFAARSKVENENILRSRQQLKEFIQKA